MIVMFYFFAFFTLLLAVYAVTAPNLVRSVFALFGCLCGVAGLYVFAQADFIAVAQIVVYVGGVLVVLLFGVMLSDKAVLAQVDKAVHRVFSLPKILALLSTVALAVFLIWQVMGYAFNVGAPTTVNTINNIGVNTVSVYLLPFELLAVLLLMVLIGTVYIARKGTSAE